MKYNIINSKQKLIPKGQKGLSVEPQYKDYGYTDEMRQKALKEQQNRNNDYLNNPFNLEQLKNRTKELLQMFKPMAIAGAGATAAITVPASLGPIASATSVAARGAIQGAGIGMLPGMSTGNATTDALAGVGGEMLGPVAGKVISKTAPIIKKGIQSIPIYKLNPWAFKSNPNMLYRGLGKAGVEDAQSSGVFRPKQVPVKPIRNENVSLQDDGVYLNEKLFSKTYYSPDVEIAGRYGKGYIAEVPNTAAEFNKRYHGSNWSMNTNTQIPVTEGTILKKDWLRGYKPVNTNSSSVSKIESKINWGKWNKEILDNPKLLEEYNNIEQTSKANGTWMKNPDGTAFTGIPEQFVQQHSKNFKLAFGNTKLVDEYGNPQIYYHGTRTADAIKKEGFSSDLSGKGNRGASDGYHYFADNKENAQYTGIKEDKYQEKFKLVQSVINRLGEKINTPYQEQNQITRNLENQYNKLKQVNPTFFNKKKLINSQKELSNKIKDSDETARLLNSYESGLEFIRGNKGYNAINPWNIITGRHNLISPTEISQKAKDIVLNASYNTKDLKYSPEVLETYLNIETPLIRDFGYKPTDKNPLTTGSWIDAMEYSDKKGAPFLKELHNPKYSGGIQKNLFDVLYGNVAIVKNANQIKSAIGNNGMFDMTNPNIYKSLGAGLLGASQLQKKGSGGKLIKRKK